MGSKYIDRPSRYGDSRVKYKTMVRPSYLQLGSMYWLDDMFILR